MAALGEVVALFKAESAAKAKVKVAASKLNQKALAQYGKLTLDEVQALVIDDKWAGTIRGRIGSEVSMLGRDLVARLHVLASRYESTLQELDHDVEKLGARVAAHLAAMGVKG